MPMPRPKYCGLTKSGKPRKRRSDCGFSPSVQQQLLEWVADGLLIRRFCEQHAILPRKLYRWIETDQDFADRFRLAKEVGYDMLAERALIELEATPSRLPDGRIDMAAVQHARNVFTGRLQLLGRWAAGKYGDRTAAAAGAQVIVQVLTGVPQVDASAARLADSTAQPPLLQQFGQQPGEDLSPRWEPTDYGEPIEPQSLPQPPRKREWDPYASLREDTE